MDWRCSRRNAAFQNLWRIRRKFCDSARPCVKQGGFLRLFDASRAVFSGCPVDGVSGFDCNAGHPTPSFRAELALGPEYRRRSKLLDEKRPKLKPSPGLEFIPRPHLCGLCCVLFFRWLFSGSRSVLRSSRVSGGTQTPRATCKAPCRLPTRAP